MKRFSGFSIMLLALTLAIPAFGDDQQKAEKQLHKITAMATDATGRRVVSITVADVLEAKRPDLVMERRTMNLNYGDLFVAHVLVKSGTKMDDIAAQLKAGKNVGQIANDQHADWKAGRARRPCRAAERPRTARQGRLALPAHLGPGPRRRNPHRRPPTDFRKILPLRL